jgi:outer membrane biosynthesis protein TonB
MLEGSRIAGEKMITPDDVTKTEINRSGKTRIIGSFKLCLTVGGAIQNVTMLKSTGFPAYDNKILSTMKGTWRYRPYNVNGKPVPVCTAVTFVYSQS